MTQRQRDYMVVWIGAIGIAVCMIVLLSAAWATAASLKVCFKDVPTEATSVKLYVGGLKAVEDVLVGGASQADGSTCTTLTPVPPAVSRTTAQAYTLKSANSVGEEGAASNAISFRFPAIPGQATLVSISGTTP